MHILRQKWFLSLKVVVLLLVAIALAAEIIPEVEAKIIVVPALIIVIMLGIIEIRNR
jgi:hypothetical protein